MATRTAGNRNRNDDSTPGVTPKSARWILGPVPDMLLVVASPLFIVTSMTIARGIWTAAAISAFVMIWQIGHHLPGMMRAYGDPALFKRFRVRFVLAPLTLLLACGFAYRFGLESGVVAIASVWGWWHYVMQAYGFSRIYDAKSGSFAASTRWLDQAMCMVWFGAAVVLNDNTLYGFADNFQRSGLPIPSVAVFDGLRSAMRGGLLAITVLFLLNHLWRWHLGERPSWIKVALMTSTFACFWYSTATVTNIVVAYAFFELFHDMQYLTIVWAFNSNRVKKDASLTGFTRWLFQPRVVFVAVYLILIAAYGSLKYGSTRVTGEQLKSMLMAVFMTSTLLHYYFDGFIWKLREQHTQSSLDLKAVSGEPRGWSMPRGLRHALLWLLFIGPFGLTMVSQAMQRVAQQSSDAVYKVQKVVADCEHMANVAPNSFMAHFTLGKTYELVGRPADASRELKLALELHPDFDPAQEALQSLGY